MAANQKNQSSDPNTILRVVLIAYLMILLDLSIVYTGMPEIGRAMHMSPVTQTWVQNAYLLCFGGFLLLSARLGDLYGRRRMLQIGIALFTLASLIIGMAQTPYELVAARAVQGLGASILAPSVLAIISTTFAEGASRTRALAWYSIVAGAGASLGMVMGGFFAGLLSWRVGFMINIPIGTALFFWVGRYIPENEKSVGSFDIAGAVLSTAGFGLLVFGLVNAANSGWSDHLTLLSLTLSVGILAYFFWHEGHVQLPLLPLRLFQSRARSAAYLARMLYVGSIVSFFFFGTQLMQGVLGYSAFQAGLGFLPVTIVQFISAMTIPRLSQKIGNVPMLMGALALVSISLFWLARAGANATLLDLALPMVVLGLGNGAAMAPLTLVGVSGVADADQGAASGLVNVAHQLGGSIGLSLLIVVFSTNIAPDLAGTAQMAHQLDAVFTGAALMNVIALILTAFFILPQSQKTEA